ncbi:MAG: redox-regulated ATPase YchF [Deltaproteobacteria bacterium]|nr:redox-regulated ATPase YchF [Deltaproteobacteria bacterium]
MGFNCGIVGLPNVGKSTLFNAMTQANAPAANYPFCTIDHHNGIVAVPDRRLDDIASKFGPLSVIPTTVEFVDIAGLVEGASKGEGLGNKFLGHIRATDAIAHVVRCFDDPSIVHTYGAADPVNDIEIITTELVLADLDSVTKRFDKIASAAKIGNAEAKKEFPSLEKIKIHVETGKPVRSLELDKADHELCHTLGLITSKPLFYVLNANESDIKTPSDKIKKVLDYAKKDNAPAVIVAASIESELATLSPEDRKAFLDDLGLEEPGLHRVIRTGYALLNLITYFTAGKKEVRAWTIHNGDTAPQAAGKIHSDFERGFIRAETYHYDDLMKYGNEQAVKAAGRLRSEGADYLVQDGDIMNFRFNV